MTLHALVPDRVGVLMFAKMRREALLLCAASTVSHCVL